MREVIVWFDGQFWPGLAESDAIRGSTEYRVVILDQYLRLIRLPVGHITDVPRGNPRRAAGRLLRSVQGKGPTGRKFEASRKAVALLQEARAGQ